jgi:hypothetical protein
MYKPVFIVTNLEIITVKKNPVVIVLGYPETLITFKPIGRGEVFEMLAIKPAYAFICGYPDKALAVLH